MVANADCGWLRTQHQDRGLRFAWRGQNERRLKHPIQGEPLERFIWRSVSDRRVFYLLEGCYLLEIDYPRDANEAQSLHIDEKWNRIGGWIRLIHAVFCF